MTLEHTLNISRLVRTTRPCRGTKCMELKIEKFKPRASGRPATSNPGGQKARDFTAKMHFYSVHNAGEQLRYASPARTGKKPDRMVGR